MSTGKKIGYFALGIAPAAIVLIWQFFVTMVAMAVYTVMKMADPVIRNLEAGSEAYNTAMEQITVDFMSGTPMAVTSFTIYIGYLLIFGLWYYFMYCRKKQTGSWKQVLKPKRILCIIGAGLLIQLGIDMALMVILPLFPNVYDSYMSVMEGLGSDSIFMILCVAILAPIGEELIFRGLIFRTLRKAVPWQAAFLIQAVLFGVYHLNLVQGIYAALLGLCMGYLAYKYGSVVPGILLHMVINSSSYLISYLLPESLAEQNVIMILIGVVSLAGMALLLFISGKGVSDMGETVASNSAAGSVQSEQA